MTETEYAHIAMSDHHVPVLAGTHTKVVEIAQDYLVHHSSPEEMQLELPHLSLGQILSALAYYYDHQEEMDAEIERRRGVVEEYRSESGDGPLAAKLRASGRLP